MSIIYLYVVYYKALKTRNQLVFKLFFNFFSKLASFVQQDSKVVFQKKKFSKFPLKRGNEMIYVNVYYSKTPNKKNLQDLAFAKILEILSLGDALGSTYQMIQNH